MKNLHKYVPSVLFNEHDYEVKDTFKSKELAHNK